MESETKYPSELAEQADELAAMCDLDIFTDAEECQKSVSEIHTLATIVSALANGKPWPACEHGEKLTTEHTCSDDEPDCFFCTCCGNCREGVDSSDLCTDCGGIDESD